MPPLNEEQRTTSRITALVLINAMIFQEELARQDERVTPLRRCISGDLFADPPSRALASHWTYILEDINYLPIFQAARDLIVQLPASEDVERALVFLGERALDITKRSSPLRHDLMGRVFHQLLLDAKYLGTYYTSIPAATILLKLALAPASWDTQWADSSNIGDLRIGDLACGTGTLLMAAAEAVTDNYVRGCSELGRAPDLRQLHRRLIEDIIYGYDVLPTALHLTASTLALRSSDVTFHISHLFSLPLGGPEDRLGSIEFLSGSSIGVTTNLFGPTLDVQTFSGTGPKAGMTSLPQLDLCVMNPPFTRSVGGNLLFGSLPDKVQRLRMQERLKREVSRTFTQASITAGLGSVFVAVADRHLKTGGRLALVLPRALLSGVAWNKTRELLRNKYEVEHVIVSHDPGRWNFSENTDLSEVLVVARKTKGTEEKSHGVGSAAGRVTCVNLWSNPRTSTEALSIASSIARNAAPDLTEGQGALPIESGGAKIGEAVSVAWSAFRDGSWMLPCAFAQSDLARVAEQLRGGMVRLPGSEGQKKVRLCTLGDLGVLGPDRRDIHDGFALSKSPTAYPALWGHNADRCTCMKAEANAYLSPLPSAKPGRTLRKVTDLWPRAGRVFLAERMWLHTQRLVAVALGERGLSNVWWPLALHSGSEEEAAVLVMWLNSTLGLLMLLAQRDETRGAWVDFKKPSLTSIPVLDVRNLASAQKRRLGRVFSDLGTREVLPLPKMGSDPVRQQIDDAFSSALGLPDLSLVRRLLGREPVISLTPMPEAEEHAARRSGVETATLLAQ